MYVLYFWQSLGNPDHYHHHYIPINSYPWNANLRVVWYNPMLCLMKPLWSWPLSDSSTQLRMKWQTNHCNLTSDVINSLKGFFCWNDQVCLTVFCVKVIGTLTFDVGFKVTLDKRLITKLVKAKIKRGFRVLYLVTTFCKTFWGHSIK